ncbi:class F sortase [Prauserella shujinwangii]|uniref:class F sortase n=1 Tax=Prauserella shujinwangii TaxID=1453103 RepID=UPI001FE875C8|nr:class F sortase [Prauserella shujinwangii]
MASLALVALALSGCTATGEQIDRGAMTPATSAADRPAPPGSGTASALPRSVPAWVAVPRIGARSSLVPLGLNPDRTIAVPPVHEPMQAGWYRYGPTPGEKGPAVVLGHVDGDGREGIFARLRELRPGDEIRVGRQDGRIARFVVEHMAQVPKTRFPAEDVYGDTAGPELRLITCGGAFDSDADSYRDNVIAFATFTGVAPSPAG